jgi:hypothetical protein
MAEIVKDTVDDFHDAVLVKHHGKYYIVSSLAAAFDTGMPETLVFPATKEGKVKSWGEVAGGRYYTREEAIAELEVKVT